METEAMRGRKPKGHVEMKIHIAPDVDEEIRSLATRTKTLGDVVSERFPARHSEHMKRVGRKNCDYNLTRFLGEGGYDAEREQALEVFTVGKKYRVIGGSMGQLSTRIELEGVPGCWNSVLFDIDIHKCPAVKDSYKSSYVMAVRRANAKGAKP